MGAHMAIRARVWCCTDTNPILSKTLSPGPNILSDQYFVVKTTELKLDNFSINGC